jgi:hypothetical protein
MQPAIIGYLQLKISIIAAQIALFKKAAMIGRWVLGVN